MYMALLERIRGRIYIRVCGLILYMYMGLLERCPYRRQDTHMYMALLERWLYQRLNIHSIYGSAREDQEQDIHTCIRPY